LNSRSERINFDRQRERFLFEWHCDGEVIEGGAIASKEISKVSKVNLFAGVLPWDSKEIKCLSMQER
jgi:hypothetical protein